jgi:hypothetical protein
MACIKLNLSKKTILRFAGAASVMLVLPGIALAQVAGVTDGSGIFCWVAQYFKQIVGGAALVAIFMWAIEHIFGAAKLHDIVIKVGVACGMVIAGAAMVKQSGLATCVGV